MITTLEQRINAGKLTLRELNLIKNNVNNKQFIERAESGLLMPKDKLVLENFARNNYQIKDLEIITSKNYNHKDFQLPPALIAAAVGTANAKTLYDGNMSRKNFMKFGITGLVAFIMECKQGGGDDPTPIDPKNEEYIINIKNSMKDGTQNTIRIIALPGSYLTIDRDELGVDDMDSHFMVIRNINWGTVLAKTDNGSLYFRLPNRGGELDLYGFPSDDNNQTAYDKSGGLLVGRNSAWVREQISGVVDNNGNPVDINWGQHNWEHAFNEFNRVVSTPYSIGASASSSGGSNKYGFRNEAGFGGKGDDYIYVNPERAFTDLSRKRAAIEELFEKQGGYNNLNDNPSQSILIDSQRDTINDSGHKITRLINLINS